MKKLISTFIILFVLTYISLAGFFIVEAGFSTKYSNAQLIADLFVPVKSIAMGNIAHLADATSSVTQPTPEKMLSSDSLSTLTPIASANATDTSNTSTVEQNFEVLAATLMHFDNNSTTAMK